MTTSSISQPASGMNTDLNDLYMKANQYSFALNAAIENETGSDLNIQNDSSNRKSVAFPDGFKVIGKKYIPEAQRTIFALVNPTTGDSEFGEVRDCYFDDDSEDIEGTSVCCDEMGQAYIERTPLEDLTQTPYCSYRTIINADCLDFDIYHPVDIEYKVTNYGINIYFVDYKNAIRFLYLNYDSNLDLQIQDRFKIILGYDPDDCDVAIYSEELDCNKIRYNPDYSRPCVELVDLVAGGSIPAGVVQVLVAYADVNQKPLTKYFPATAPIPIREKDISFEINYVTAKALYIKINHLEQSNIYGYYNIVIAETVDNYTTFKLVATLPVTQDTFTYTNNNPTDYQSLTPNDIFFERPIYSTAASVTKTNEYLFYGRMKEAKKMNLQRVANRIKLYWQTKAITEKNLRNPANVAKFRGFMRDEVYPLGIVFELIDDNDTLAFHIPGATAAYFNTAHSINVNSIVSNNDVLLDPTCAELTRNKLWQVYNTGLVLGTPHTYTENCEDEGCWEWGEFAYWESTRLYPNIPEVWGELCGLPIRHHKFPDSKVTHIHDGLSDTKGFVDTNIVYPIGIKVDEVSIRSALSWAVSQNIITQEERDRIKGYRIVRGNRVGNKSIVAKGLLYDMWRYVKGIGKDPIYFPNFGYNDLRANNYISQTTDVYQEESVVPLTFTKTGRYTFHSPDTHFNNPSLGTEVKLETEEYGESEGFFNLCEEQPKYKLLSTPAYALAYSFGIAAALSSLEEKECLTYTVRADNFSQSKVTGQTPVGVVTGGGGTLAAGSGTILNNSTSVNNYAFSADGKAVSRNTFVGTDPDLGAINTTNPNSTFNDGTTNPFFRDFKKKNNDFNQTLNVSEYTATTCKGSTYQTLNSNSGIGGLGGLSGILSGITGILTGETLNGIVYRTIIALREMQVMLDLFETLVPSKNQTIQYNSAGRYNNYIPIDNTGNKIRKIEHATYLTPHNVIVNETVPIKVNNWHRESSVYLKADHSHLFPDTTTVDNSRVTMDDISYGYGDLNRIFNRDIASYYAAIKDFKPDQYGSVYNIQYLETNGCSFIFGETNTLCTTLFGGDTFINRFALKRKHPFFIQTRFKMSDESDVLYSDLGNAGYPAYFFNTKETLFERLAGADIGDIFSSFSGFLSKVTNTPRSNMDAKVSQLFFQKGYTHLYHYGIPYFFAESDVNVDYRHGENHKEKDYYPHNTDLANWLQEKEVPISEDNYYIYNKSYSKQNKESALHTIKPQYKFNDEKAVTYNNRLVYTDRTNMLAEGDNWLILRGNNLYETDISRGKIISIDGIEDAKVVIRNENASQIFNAFDTLATSAGEIQVSKGGMFETRPQDFAVTDLGFMGSQHRDMLKTEFGHLWTDAKRGQVFLLGLSGDGVDELAKYGMKNWFKQNLPFQLLKDFPNISQEALDNNFRGLGLHLGFDKRFGRFFITKLDYKVKDKTVTSYNPLTTKFTIGDGEDIEEVEITNSEYFEDKSWTISYNIQTKSWVSYHSFIPNYYVDLVDYFQTGVNSAHSSLWSHNITNKSFQVYYGKLYPFTIDILTEPSLPMSYLYNIDYMADVLRFHNQYNWFYNRNITFNKAIVYNERQSSGELSLIPKIDNNFSTIGLYPRTLGNKTEIEISNSQNMWSFNEFYDLISCQQNNVPIWINDANNVDKKLNPKAFDFGKNTFDKARLRSKSFHVRLINDKWSNYKFLFYLTQFNQNKSVR